MNIKYLLVLPVVAVVFIISNFLLVTSNTEVNNVETVSVFKLQSLASALTSLQDLLTSDTTTAIAPLGCELNTDSTSVVKGEKFKLNWTTTGADNATLVSNRGYKKEGVKLNNKSFRVGTAKKKVGNIRYTLKAYDAQGNKKICRKTITITEAETAPVAAVVSSQTTKLSWNTLGSGYKYSLDIKPKGKAWIGPCVDAAVISGKNTYTYKGTCPGAGNQKVAKKDVGKFRLFYTKGQWGDGTAKYVTINNDVTKNKLNFLLESEPVQTPKNCVFQGLVIDDGEKFDFYSERTVAKGKSCSPYKQTRTCTDGVLSGSNTYSNNFCTVLEEFTGVNVNRRPEDLNSVLLDRTKTQWIRASVDILNYYEGKEGWNFEEWEKYKVVQRAGKKTILNLMWNFESRKNAPDNRIPVPNSQREQDLFEYLDTEILDKLMPYVDVIISGNEPFVNSLPEDLEYNEKFGGIPLVVFYKRVTNHVQEYMLKNGIRDEKKLYVGSFTRLHSEVMKTGQAGIAVKELLDFAEKQPYVDGIDVHTHVFNLSQIEDGLKYVRQFSQKPIIVTEYTYVKAKKMGLTQRLDKGVKGELFVNKYGRDGLMTVDEYMREITKKPVLKQEWSDFFKSRDWFINNFVIEADKIFRKYAVNGSTFGLNQRQPNFKNPLPWYMGYLFSPITVKSEDGKTPTNYQNFSNFVFLQTGEYPTCSFNGKDFKEDQTLTRYTQQRAPEGGTCADVVVTATCSDSSFGGVLENTYASCAEYPVFPGGTVSSKGVDSAMLTMPDGEMLLLQVAAARVYKKGEEKKNKVYTLSSIDNGKTWKRKGVATEYEHTANTRYGLNNASITRLESGRLMGTYHLWTSVSTNTYSEHSIETMYSDDKGKTWKYLTRVSKIRNNNGDLQKGLWEPYIVEPSKKPGVLQIYYAQERDGAEVCKEGPKGVVTGQDIVMKESTDGGKTWGKRKIVLRNGQSREGVPTITELTDGSLVLLHEGKRYAACGDTTPQLGLVPSIAISNDGGDTWKDLGPAFLPKNDKIRSGWPHMTQLQDGRLAIRFTKEKSINDSTREIILLLTTNIPSYNSPPVWQKNGRIVMEGLMWGSIGQAQNEDIVVTAADLGTKQMYKVIPYSSLPKPPITTTLTWNNIGANYQYSLDVQQKGKPWVAACVGSETLGQTTAYTFDGSCASAKKAENKTIPADTINKFRLCGSSQGQGGATTECKVLKNDLTKETQNFKLEVPRAEKPNILFIMLDDAGYDDYTNTASDIIKPNMDRLASESTRFEQFYTNPMCTPTRMTLLSGNYAMKYGISWVCGSNAVYGIPSNNVTLPEMLSTFGYKTSTFGKWHAGKGREQYEAVSKFDYSATTEGPVKNGYFDPVFIIDGQKQKPLEGKNLVQQTATNVIDQINKQTKAGEPFLVNYWLNAPHGPYQPTLEWAKKYVPEIKTAVDYFKTDSAGNITKDILDKWKKKKNKPALYKGLMSQADVNIGRVLEVIDSDPYLKKNTIVMLVSDNGGTAPVHPDGNGPLRGFKTDVFEGGTRLPLFIRWPGMAEAGVTDTSVVSVEDVYPTIMELVGGTVPKNIAGKSFASIVLNEKSDVPRQEPLFRAHKVKNEFLKETDSLYEYDLMSYFVRDGKWKLVYEPLEEGKKIFLFDMSACASKGSAQKSCEEDSDDVSRQNPKRFADMKKMYRDWLFKTAKIPLKPETYIKDAKKSLTTDKYTFTKSGGAVKLKNRLDFDITRLDATFTARITPEGRDGTVRVIARRGGSWVFRINEDNKLELQIFGIDGEKKVQKLIEGTRVLTVGKTYDVAFTLYAFKSRNTVAKIYSRNVAREGRLIMDIEGEVPPLRSNDNTMTFGAGKNDRLNMFIGTIESPKMLKAPLTRGQIEKFMGIDVAVTPTESVLGVSTSRFEQGGLIANVISAAQTVVETLKNLLKQSH